MSYGALLVFGEVDANRFVIPYDEQGVACDNGGGVRCEGRVDLSRGRVDDTVDHRAGGCYLQVERDVFQCIQQLLALREGDSYFVFGRVEDGLFAFKRSAEVQQVLPDAVDDAFARGDGVDLLVVGHAKDINDCLFAKFRSFANNAIGNIGVVDGPCDLRLGGIIAFLFRQYVVVQVGGKNRFFWHNE